MDKKWRIEVVVFLVLLLVLCYTQGVIRDPDRWDGVTFSTQGHQFRSFSPQLNWVTYTSHNPRQNTILLVPLPILKDKVEITFPSKLLNSHTSFEVADWMPDGTGFLVQSYGGVENTQTWWLMKVNDLDAPIPLCTFPNSLSRVVNWSPTSTAFALVRVGEKVPGEGSGVTIVHTDGSGCEELSDFGLFGLDTDFSWSPDGQEIAYSYESWPSPETRILNLSTHETTTVYAAIGAPIWFPDGDRIALRVLLPDDEWGYTFPHNGENILVIHADGSGLIKDVELPGGYKLAKAGWGYSWSPDGSHLAIPLKGFFDMAIGILDSDDLTLSVLRTPEFLKILGWTPDGSAIVVLRSEGFSEVLREIPVAP